MDFFNYDLKLIGNKFNTPDFFFLGGGREGGREGVKSRKKRKRNSPVGTKKLITKTNPFLSAAAIWSGKTD